MCIYRVCDCSENPYIIANANAVTRIGINNNSSNSSTLMLKDLVQQHAESLGL